MRKIMSFSKMSLVTKRFAVRLADVRACEAEDSADMIATP